MYESHPYYASENVDRGESRLSFYDARFSRVEKLKGETGQMLSIGCLEGGYALQQAKARGWQVQGVEFSSILAGHARRQLELDVVVADAWDLVSLGDQAYDLVYSHSLEHVPDARYSIAQSRRLLKPDGLLMLEVPNQFYSLKDKLKDLLTTLAPRSNRMFYQEVKAEFHTFFFNPHTLRELLVSEGYEILSLRTYLPNHPVYLFNPRGRWLQEFIYAIGGLVGRGPCIEVVAKLK
jgi:SAM-dependent methyltransferase